jgi:hypothetical protein
MRPEERRPGKREVDMLATEIEALAACLSTYKIGPFECQSREMRDSMCDDENVQWFSVQWFQNVCVGRTLRGTEMLAMRRCNDNNVALERELGCQLQLRCRLRMGRKYPLESRRGLQL